MMSKEFMLNGVRRLARSFKLDEVQVGDLLRLRFGRTVYRVVAFDGEEAVLRSVHAREQFVAWPVGDIEGHFLLVVPEGQDG